MSSFPFSAAATTTTDLLLNLRAARARLRHQPVPPTAPVVAPPAYASLPNATAAVQPSIASVAAHASDESVTDPLSYAPLSAAASTIIGSEYEPPLKRTRLNNTSANTATTAATAAATTAATAANANESSSSSSAVWLNAESLLQYKSVKELQSASLRANASALLLQPSMRTLLSQQTYMNTTTVIHHHCRYRTRERCNAARREKAIAAATGTDPTIAADATVASSSPYSDICDDIHFTEVIVPGVTDRRLGDCPHLQKCERSVCRRIHYRIDEADKAKAAGMRISEEEEENYFAATTTAAGAGDPTATATATPPISASPLAAPLTAPLIPLSTTPTRTQSKQWINCDLTTFDLSLLGSFDGGVVLLDPPSVWQINMSLPYALMDDDAMMRLPIGCLQTYGICAVWVVTRALDSGRRCLQAWGYREVGEVIWCKVDQLNRLLKTGRTGPYINHTKEHCLIGIKGYEECENSNSNRDNSSSSSGGGNTNSSGTSSRPRLSSSLHLCVDCDVIVSPTRETSRKPDEMYALLDRLAPNKPKIELFGRQHNTREGWFTLGNQVAGLKVDAPLLRARILARYPQMQIFHPEMLLAQNMEDESAQQRTEDAYQQRYRSPPPADMPPLE